MGRPHHGRVKVWLTVLSELKGRGITDVCIVCCDGLTGLPDAIGVTWPQAIVQLCVVLYPDTAVMPIPGREGLTGGGDRVAGIGIITGLRGRPAAGRVAGSGPAGWSGRGLAA